MAVSGFNYLLLARLGVVHGYYPEVRSLLRDCYERMSRCMLFKREPKVAQSWLNGSKIQQREVDDKLSKSLEGEDPMQAKVYQQLRGKYYQDSEAVHPNLSSLLMRLAVDSPEEAADRVGKDVFLGGVMGKHYGRVTLLTVVSSARIAVTVFRNLFEGNLNEFDEEFDDLNALFDAAAQPG